MQQKNDKYGKYSRLNYESKQIYKNVITQLGEYTLFR